MEKLKINDDFTFDFRGQTINTLDIIKELPRMMAVLIDVYSEVKTKSDRLNGNIGVYEYTRLEMIKKLFDDLNIKIDE